MTQLDTARAADEAAAALRRPVRRIRVAGVFVLTLAAVVVLAGVHLTQGTSTVGAGDLVKLVFGQGTDNTANVLIASRLPRLLAGVLVGIALGFAGAGLQSLARNPLASPDTLGVNAGAYLAVVTVAALGIQLPVLPAGGVAFTGGLAAAVLVLALSAGGTTGPTRLILAGSAVAMALGGVTTTLMLLYREETVGTFAWSAGTLVQTDLNAVSQMAPLVAIGIIGSLILAGKLDILALGDDTASVLGVHVRRVRVIITLLTVLLSAAAVTVTGPVGFVGLVAPVLVRLIAPLVPGLLRHRVLLPLSGLAGILVVLLSDVVLRAALGGQAGVEIPTGIMTMMVGAIVLVWLARRYRDSGPSRSPGGAGGGLRSRRTFLLATAVLLVLLVTFAVFAMLAGDAFLRTGDIVNWANNRSGRVITYVLDARFPRVLAAILSGAALAIAGAVVQAVCRNPLAEPGILGITGGAGVGAVATLVLAPAAGIWLLSGVAAVGALATFALVYLVSWRGGLSSDRLVLIGVGVSSAATAVITLMIVATDPWNISLAMTWLSGSTYGRTLPQVLPVTLALLVLTPVMLHARRELDLLALDDDVPRVLGVRLERTRLVMLLCAALMTAAAVSAIGVVGFVGLVAPHAARALVGGSHARILPVAALLGAVLVSISDSLGRTLIAPAQIPAGLLTAMIGAPYFVYLLWRTRLPVSR
ncbi:iron ABC transporter permease [Kribbella sandramycini]|uniref:Iron ABC transporter permease n=1 Tax=Kribbella sandramycini TaxID=60450 RepID=A0A7Y4L520_9ACTN|nr:iron ABC transporter permease [Kribbella sandramycini]MBB6571786.1 iron complex transport system permease protein [Kribbella sandramycini]NOL44428.1 iron ABC transporter permease [Kribbella sandramycini]